MATDDDEIDFEGPPTRPTPSPYDVAAKALADLVTHMRGLADELHELRVGLRKTGLSPEIRASIGGALRRLRAQASFTAEVVDPRPLPGRRPNARTYKTKGKRARRRRPPPGGRT